MAGEMEEVGSVVVTDSLYGATLLGTLGCEPQSIVSGKPGADGKPKIRWTYKLTPVAEEALRLWQADQKGRDWTQLNKDEKKDFVYLLHSFCDNVKFYRAHVAASKKGSNGGH